MNPAAAPALPQTHLSQLSARWVSAYRVVWCLLAFAALGLLAATLIHPAAHPAILALRMFKAAVLVSVSAILLRRRGSDPVAALLSLAFLAWTITSSFDFLTTDLLPMLLDHVRFVLFAMALLLFPDGSWRPRWTRRVAIASGGVFLIGLAEGIGALQSRLFLPLAIACVAAAVTSLFARFRTAESEAVRQQLKWVALGLVAGIGLILCARAGAALNAASPMLQPMPVLWEAMFQLGIVIVALGFLVSLLRFRLFDAETAISRSAAFAALGIAVVAVFAGTEATIENLGQAYLGMGIGNISAAMAAAVAAVFLNPLHERISAWAERRFQRDLVQLKRELPELLEDLADSSSTRELGAAALPCICRAIHATRAALLVHGEVAVAEGVDLKAVRGQRTDPDRGDPGLDLFPVRLPMRLQSARATQWLLLGPRPDGTLYGREDLDAVRQILPALRRALVMTAANEARLKDDHRARNRIARQLAHFEDRILKLEADLRSTG